MPGSEKPVEFMLEATRGLSAIDEASLERRYYDTDPNLKLRHTEEKDGGVVVVDNEKVDPYTSFEAFKGSDSYQKWVDKNNDSGGQLQEAAVSASNRRSQEIAVIENNLKLRPWKDPPPNVAGLDVSNTLSQFGSTGAKGLLAAEADARSKLAAGGTGTLSPEQLGRIESVRATVQRERFELDQHLLDVAWAVHKEVCNQTGETFADGKTWKDSGFADLFTRARNALVEFNDTLRWANIDDSDKLAAKGKDVLSALTALLEKAPSLVKAVEEKKGQKADTPVTNSGLELQLTLIAQEVGQQVFSRIAPSFAATYRIVTERVVPADRLGKLDVKLLNDDFVNLARTWGQKGKNWTSNAENIKVFTQVEADLCFSDVLKIGKMLTEWPSAFDETPKEGPAKIHGLALRITNWLHSMEREMALNASKQDQYIKMMRPTTDALFTKLRLDTNAAVKLLGGEAT